jgi:hypothetical protein
VLCLHFPSSPSILSSRALSSLNIPTYRALLLVLSIPFLGIANMLALPGCRLGSGSDLGTFSMAHTQVRV